MSKRQVEITTEVWPLHTPFVIARSSRITTETIRVKISQSGASGYGECVPTARYGESISSVLQQLNELKELIESGLSRELLQLFLVAGAARNALDCALWDLEAKLADTRVCNLLNVSEPGQIMTVQTLSIDSPESMAEAANKLKHYPMLKVKLDRELVLDRLLAVHEGAPQAQLLVDANESWDLGTLENTLSRIGSLPICMIEQPLPQGQDEQLSGLCSPVAIGADESCHTSADIEFLARYYDVINIKFDKCGGLTEALKMLQLARKSDLKVMVGCMLGSSLSMAPALYVAQFAEFVDLDGPTMLSQDIRHGLTYQNGIIGSLPQPLWGGVC